MAKILSSPPIKFVCKMCGTALSRATRKTLKITILQYFHFANELFWRTTEGSK
jgi:hypothetical protein